MWEGREEGRQFRGGAKTRIGFQRATRKWEVGPLYRRTHQAGLLAVQGRLGPGGGGKNTAAMGGHPLISMASQVLASATSGSESDWSGV